MHLIDYRKRASGRSMETLELNLMFLIKRDMIRFNKKNAYRRKTCYD